MAKQNSMDVIQIRYGVDLSNPPGINSSSEEKRAFERKKAQAKTCSLRAFIYPEKYPDEAPKSFTKNELKIQEALRFLYEQNEKAPPLFKKFPDWRQALVIDCTGAKGSYTAAFNPIDNVIQFESRIGFMHWVAALAHELKHAEHCTKEQYRIIKQETKMDCLGQQQSSFLDESIAYPFGNYMQMLYFLHNGVSSVKDAAMQLIQRADMGTEVVIKPIMKWFMEKPKPKFLDKILGRKPEKNYKELEQKLIPLMLDHLYHSPYKAVYDQLSPVQKSDEGLRRIPDSFGLDRTYAKKLLAGKLQEVPRNNLMTFVQYVAEKKNKSKILSTILAQENEDGSGVLGRDQYDDLIWNVKAEKDIEGLKSLLKKKNKTGISWVSSECKIELLQYMLREPIEDTTAFVSELQNGSSAVFNTDEQIAVLQNDSFWTPIDKRRDFKLAKILDGSPKHRKDHEQEIESEIKGKVKFICALLADKKNLSQWPKIVLTQAIKFGYTEIAKHVLNMHTKNGALALRQDAVQDYFSEMLKMDTAWNEHLSVGEQSCLQKRATQMLSIFLNLKDEKGQPVIDEKALKDFIKSTSSEKTPILCQALEQYQSEYPDDERFKKTDLQKFLQSNQKQTKRNNPPILKDTLSVGQRSTIKNKQSQH